jgi:hypothetical protein
MSVNQGRNKGDETMLYLHDAKNDDLGYRFTKRPEEDIFSCVSTTYSGLNKTGRMPTTVYRNKDGEVGVRGFDVVKGDTLNLGYTEKNGVPIVTVELSKPLNGRDISHKPPFVLKLTGVNNDLTRVENWQVVPPEEGFKDVSMAKEVAEKIKSTVADWYQQVHPDLLLKEAGKLPSRTLEELGVSVVTTTTPPEV